MSEKDAQEIIESGAENASDSNSYFRGFEEEEFSFSDPRSSEDQSPVDPFPFDEPRSIRLKNGSIHNFSIPTRNQEKRKQQLQRTLIITSPAVINGQNPRSIKTEYSKAQAAHYQDIILSVKGYAFEEGDDPKVELDAKRTIREEPHRTKEGVMIPIPLSSLIPVPAQIAAVSRIYGGKIEVVKPEGNDGQKPVVVLNSKRWIEVRQELGVEQNDDGSFSDPDYRLLYRFNEAGSEHLSKWETSCFSGFTLNNPKGGSKEERTFNVDACVALFDSLIESVEGGTVGGMPIDIKNADHLAAIPDSIKVTIISFVMNDITTNSGN